MGIFLTIACFYGAYLLFTSAFSIPFSEWVLPIWAELFLGGILVVLGIIRIVMLVRKMENGDNTQDQENDSPEDADDSNSEDDSFHYLESDDIDSEEPFDKYDS
ncbi:MAG: hypothetical protein IKE27_09555 [Oscillospiraceae bacterium]|nr:hypothetical protein [Oscillospiraceae bacterium]